MVTLDFAFFRFLSFEKTLGICSVILTKRERYKEEKMAENEVAGGRSSSIIKVVMPTYIMKPSEDERYAFCYRRKAMKYFFSCFFF
jgi:hypothetical protein